MFLVDGWALNRAHMTEAKRSRLLAVRCLFSAWKKFLIDSQTPRLFWAGVRHVRLSRDPKSQPVPGIPFLVSTAVNLNPLGEEFDFLSPR